MPNELFFEIPDDPSVMGKVVEAVPSPFWWLQGSLYAMPSQLTRGDIEKEVGIIVFSDSIEIRGKGYFPVVIGEKSAGYIQFRDVGYFREGYDLWEGKRLAIAYLKKGYHRGDLCFSKHHESDMVIDRCAKCEISFKTSRGAGLVVADSDLSMRLAQVRLSWNPRFRGREEDIAPITRVCRELGLRQLLIN